MFRHIRRLTAFVFLFYIPLGYYTDQFIYRRRVKRWKARRIDPAYCVGIERL